ncbi:MAG TPA: ferric reductase-like transmembrane domain-containing protein [Solirubrobacteraceae bacterium]|jgi:predicted ferric reductase|nr:ferric reductase-like transmembrane domain-containing protein [Solirubrobacteraceae bacterium]
MTWYLARAGGVVAYVLLTFTVCAGMGLAGRARVPGFPRLAVNELHRFAGILTGTFIAIHVGSILLDSYVHFTVPEVLIPFAASYRDVAVALGIVAAELLVALAVTNRLRKVLPRRLWRRAHYLNFAVWALATAHGFTAGTDSTAAWLLAIYAIAIATVGGLACWRFAEPASAGASGIPAPPPVSRTVTDSAS